MSATRSTLDQPIGFQRGAGRHQIDDQAAQAQARRQLHRAVQFDAFGLHAAPGEMLGGDGRIFGGDADMAQRDGSSSPASSTGSATARRHLPMPRSSGA